MRGLIFSVASIMHAVGHAALALAAGACAQAIAGGPSLLGARSTLAARDGAGLAAAFWLASFGLAAVIVKVCGGTLASYAQAQIGGDVGGALRLEVLDGFLGRHRLRHPRQGDHGGDRALAPAAGIAALTSHVRDLESGLQVGALGGVRAVAQIVPLLVVLVWLAPKLALAAALVFAPFSAALSLARKAWKRANARAARHGEALLEAADEAVRHAELWTTYGAESRVRTHVAAIGRALANHAARLDASASALSGANEVLGAVALVCALGAARAGWIGGEGSGDGAILPFAVTFFLAYKPLRDLTDARLALARAGAALDALAPLLGGASARTGDAPDDRAPREEWRLADLRIERLVLARGAAQPLTVHAPAGAIVAIVGPTGIGKTTLLRTLLGLDAAEQGTVRYDGVALGDAPPGPRARPFAWVPQEAPLLADTLDANVSLGADANAAELLASLGAGSLAGGLEGQRLGPGGRAVSGGERQWIALARAVATRQPVLLLDEPTSGLDPASQARVLEAIARLKGERTILLVTHRPEPLAIADVVVRLGDVAPPRVTARRDTSARAS